VIDALEDAEDYAAFEMAVAADYDAQSAVEREPVLRLASLLWRLRRATAIESGLFRIQAKHLLQFRRRRQAHRDRQTIIDELYGTADVSGDDLRPDQTTSPEALMLAHHRPRRLLTKPTISPTPLFASPTCQPIRSIGSAATRPRFGVRPVRSCLRCSAWIDESHGKS
jgi:hypothetical protein